jgi:tRNA pseudouridine38-40 synthase
MQRYKLVLQYCGTKYIGWQKQGKETKHKRSIQSTLEKAVHDFVRTPTHVNICGRTDTGVHAVANVAHIDINRLHRKTGDVREPYSGMQVKNAINHHLKAMDVKDIYVNHVEPVGQDFHARFSALERTYVYKTALCRDSTGAVFEWDKRWYIRRHVDLDRVKEACKFFEGERDFSTMKPATELSPLVVRTIRSFDFEIEKPTISAGYHEPIYANFQIRAKAFMQHQVRKIMGAVMAVGTGDITVDELRRRMEAKDTSLAPKMAPPTGLYFLHVKYPETTERNPDAGLKIPYHL